METREKIVLTLQVIGGFLIQFVLTVIFFFLVIKGVIFLFRVL